MPDKLDLDAIEKRAAAAVPGPWRRNAVGHVVAPWPDGEAGEYFVCVAAVPDRVANFEFIAAARQDVPALVAAVKLARAELRKVLDFYEPAAAPASRSLSISSLRHVLDELGEVSK